MKVFEYVDSLKEKGISFTFDDKAAALIAEKSIGGKSGARELRNYIRKEVEDSITDKIVEYGEGGFSEISLTEKEGKLVITTNAA